MTILSNDFSLTKRHLGLLLLVGGGLVAVALLGIDPLTDLLHRLGSDVLPPDRQTGIGPKQALALLASVAIALVGLSLIPLGRDVASARPAQARPVPLPDLVVVAHRVLLALVVLALLGYFVVYVVYAVNLILFPFDYDQGEGFELVDTMLFSQFRWPYQDPEVFPFYSSNYPPLFHLLNVPFVWLFGPAYWYGRLLGFVGTLITAAAIGYAVYRVEPHRWVAIASGLAFLASNYVYHIGPLFRQHMSMVMFETLAVVTLAGVHHIQDTAQRRRVLAAGLGFLLAAGYTKQLALATCIAAFVYLFLYNPRRSLVWGVIFALIAGGIFLLIDVATGGQWRLNIINANINPFMPGQFEGLLRQWIGLHGVLVALAALMVVYEFYFDQISIYSLWFIAATVNSSLAGKWGAGDSYFATAIAAVSVLSGIFAARTLRGTWRLPENYLTRPLTPLRTFLQERRAWVQGLAGVAVPVLYLLYAVAVFHMPTGGAVFGTLAGALGVAPNTDFAFYDSAGWTLGYAKLGHLTTAEDVANGWQLVSVVAQSEGPVLSEDAGFNIQAGKTVVGNPTQLLNLYNNQLFDPTNLVAMIEDQTFGVLIMRAWFYPNPVLYSMIEAYEEDQVIPMNGFEYQVLRPDPTWPGRRPLRDAIFALEDDQPIEHVIEAPPMGVEEWLTMVFNRVQWELVEGWQEEEAVFFREGARAIVRYEDEGEGRVRITVQPET